VLDIVMQDLVGTHWKNRCQRLFDLVLAAVPDLNTHSPIIQTEKRARELRITAPPNPLIKWQDIITEALGD
jgi:hypothetical protein